MDQYYEDLIIEFGEPTSTKPVNSKIIEKYRGKLPDKLLEYWQEYGFIGLKNGLFWLVNPEEFDDVLESWIGDTEISKKDDYYVIARSGFGNLYLWGKKSGFMYEIQCNTGWILEKEGSEKEITEGNVDFELQLFLATRDVERIDLDDIETDKPLFDELVKKFGPLNDDEIFGFEPALFLGGEQTFQNINKLDLQTHLKILADFGQRELVTKDDLIRKAFGG